GCPRVDRHCPGFVSLKRPPAAGNWESRPDRPQRPRSHSRPEETAGGKSRQPQPPRDHRRAPEHDSKRAGQDQQVTELLVPHPLPVLPTLQKKPAPAGFFRFFGWTKPPPQPIITKTIKMVMMIKLVVIRVQRLCGKGRTHHEDLGVW